METVYTPLTLTHLCYLYVTHMVTHKACAAGAWTADARAGACGDSACVCNRRREGVKSNQKARTTRLATCRRMRDGRMPGRLLAAACSRVPAWRACGAPSPPRRRHSPRERTRVTTHDSNERLSRGTSGPRGTNTKNPPLRQASTRSDKSGGACGAHYSSSPVSTHTCSKRPVYFNH